MNTEQDFGDKKSYFFTISIFISQQYVMCLFFVINTQFQFQERRLTTFQNILEHSVSIQRLLKSPRIHMDVVYIMHNHPSLKRKKEHGLFKNLKEKGRTVGE